MYFGSERCHRTSLISGTSVQHHTYFIIIISLKSRLFVVRVCRKRTITYCFVARYYEYTLKDKQEVTSTPSHAHNSENQGVKEDVEDLMQDLTVYRNHVGVTHIGQAAVCVCVSLEECENETSLMCVCVGCEKTVPANSCHLHKSTTLSNTHTHLMLQLQYCSVFTAITHFLHLALAMIFSSL